MEPSLLHRYLEYVAARRYGIIQVIHSTYVAPLLSPHPESVTAPLLIAEPEGAYSTPSATRRETRKNRSFRRGLFLGATGASVLVSGYMLLLLLYDSGDILPLPEPSVPPSPTLQPPNPRFVLILSAHEPVLLMTRQIVSLPVFRRILSVVSRDNITDS
ncbi:hypothetical protein BP6252_12976 [Coleophoma cylindrospora]|uniref:Uncharacterized protein n=1 Tax=Coleophoma cylindrospora TaxID=1849047 RepID=A0A3D8QDJ8_9HELO|nr:hypothetical protein BP6252_12976 [Coleophoma cylindrospora]